MTNPAQSNLRQNKCARDSDWCTGRTCRAVGFAPDCPKADLPPSAVERIAKLRGCIGPYPCGRGAGAHGDDLPCVCEAALEGAMCVSAGSPELLPWTDEEAERAADVVFAAMKIMPEFERDDT